MNLLLVARVPVDLVVFVFGRYFLSLHERVVLVLLDESEAKTPKHDVARDEEGVDEGT